MPSRTLIATLVLLAGCAADVEGSSEYVELTDDRDALAAELEEVRSELDQVDDRLAVAEAGREEAEARLTAAEAVATDLRELLTLDVMNRVGLSSTDAECVVDALGDDEALRRSYLFLIDPSQTDEVAAKQAYDDVTTVMADCGLAIPQQDPAASAQAAAALEAVLGEVEVLGEPLPPFADGVVDAAVGMPAPVVVGADYAGTPVRIDPAVDGPTMVVVLAHWCPHCNAEIPKLNQLRDEGRIPDGVNIVAVSSGVNPDGGNFPPDEWLEGVDWTFPVVADGLDDGGLFVASSAYGTAGVPFVTMIDGDGIVTARWAGERDLEELASALAGFAG